MCSIAQSFDAGQKTISLNQTSCPALSLIETLNAAEGDSSESAAAKREETWKQVQAERRKSFASKDHLTNAFRQCGKVHSHSGQLNSSHRLLTASADLLSEHKDEPWLTQACPDKTAWKAIVEFCGSCTGSSDFALVFDGRMREVRRTHASRLGRPKTAVPQRLGS